MQQCVNTDKGNVQVGKKYVTIWLHKAPMKKKIGKNVMKRKQYEIDNNHNLISV